jgi:hypothetical protein
MKTNKALFYPTIEINNEDWLKSNLLFWDEIKTIVPESFKNPYNNRTTSILSERGILIPEVVNPDREEVKDSSEYILEFINTEEGLQLLDPSDQFARIHTDKMAFLHNEKLGREFKRMLRLHPMKVADKLRYMFGDDLRDGWLSVSSSFGSYYLTMLANKICEEQGMRLLTDNPLCSNLSNKVKQGIKGLNPGLREYRGRNLNQNKL